MPNAPASIVIALGCLGFAACAPASSPAADSADTAGSVPSIAAAPPDSASVREAMEALAAYLDASRENARNRGALALLTACPTDEGVTAAGPMLATFTVLPPMFRADTIVGRAVVTTVAEQDLDRQHPGYYVARLRVRSDTLEWDVLRSDAGAWVVCNGLRFGFTAPESLITWRPDGASGAAARALADSLTSR